LSCYIPNERERECFSVCMEQFPPAAEVALACQIRYTLLLAQTLIGWLYTVTHSCPVLVEQLDKKQRSNSSCNSADHRKNISSWFKIIDENIS
jgi:hypothetical protein